MICCLDLEGVLIPEIWINVAKKTGIKALEITTRDGRRVRHHTRAVRGTAANPMPRAEVAAKARDLLQPLLGDRRAQKLIDTVWQIEGVNDIRALRPWLRGGAR